MLLGIDTSGAVSVAVARGELTGPAPEILQVRSDERSRHHDEVLLALIDEAMRAAGAERSELTGVVVGRGPGPFTGLRVGIAAGIAVGQARGIPVKGLLSQAAIAEEFVRTVADESGRPVLIASDARRKEVYFSVVDSADATLSAGPFVAKPA